MKYVIIFYSVITVLSGLLVFFKMKDEKIDSEDRVRLTDLKDV